MDIVGQTYRTKTIRHDLKKPTIVEFLRDGEVISGTFKIDKENSSRIKPFFNFDGIYRVYIYFTIYSNSNLDLWKRLIQSKCKDYRGLLQQSILL